MHALFHQKTTN